MGGSISSLNGSDVKGILNTILKQLLSRTDLVDLYSLSDPERCSKYIVVGAKALEKLFLRINLEPRKGPNGKIYFQKIERVVKANPLGEEQLETCKALSFFFILILRIFAAVTLSILDSELPLSDPVEKIEKEDRRVGIARQNPPDLEGFKQQNELSSRTSSWFGYGGELNMAPFSSGGSGNYYLTENAGAYRDLLNRYLIMPSGGVPAISRDPMRFQGVDSLFIIQDTLYNIRDNPDAAAVAAGTAPRILRDTIDFTTNPPENRRRPRVMYTFKRGDVYVNMQADLLVIKNPEQNYEVTLENINFVGRKERGRTIRDILRLKYSDDKEPRSLQSNKELPALLQELFIKAADEIEPPPFSIIDFFKKSAIIDSDNTIKGTTIKIIDIENTGSIIIRYEGSLKPERGREKNVSITVIISCIKLKKIEGREQEYKLIINLNDEMDTEPEELEKILRKKGNISNSFFTGINDSRAPTDQNRYTIPQFLQKIFDKLIKSVETENIDNDNLSFNREGRPKAYNSKTIDYEYKIKRAWDALRKSPPVKAHCVARAVQLLNVSAINDPSSGQAYSSVCRLNFPYSIDGSLPKQKDSILTSEGIHAMSMLFFDIGEKLLPKVANMEKFKAFRERLIMHFHRFESIAQMKANPDKSPINNHDPTKPFNEIENTLMPFCNENQNSKLLLKGAIIGRLQMKAQELIRQQKLHITRVMQIIFKLFNEKAVRAGNFEINDYILSNGIESLYKLAEEARNLLIDYYSNCEKTYTEGLMELYNTRGKNIQFDSR
jgi:hypothetical protein